MAARPNAIRPLENGKELAAMHIARLTAMIANIQSTLTTNRTLTAENVAGYHECVQAAQTQIERFSSIANMVVPDVNLESPRGRGRPSEEELARLEAERQAMLQPAQPKKPGRKPKAVAAVAAPVAVPAPAPVQPAKRPGRPRKNAEAAPAQVPVQVIAPEQPVKRGPGRPRKNPLQVPAQAAAPAASVQTAPPAKRKYTRRAQPEAQVAVAAAPAPVVPVKTRRIVSPAPVVNAPAMSDAAPAMPVKRGPGRPKGSKNKPKTDSTQVNGQAAHTSILPSA